MKQELTIGSLIDHDRYGEGVIGKVALTTYEVYFARGGKVEISKSSADYEVLHLNEGGASNALPGIDLDAFEQVVMHFMDKLGALQHPINIGKKWEGGTLLLQPANQELKPKEIPMEAFFHKIVMLRDRLRVLEQNINAHATLTDAEKVDLQQYITRIYGSLTTFNILFDDKNDYFVGTGTKF